MFQYEDLLEDAKKQLLSIYEIEEAENITNLLFEHVFKFNKIQLITQNTYPILSDSKIVEFNSLIIRVLQSEPIQYIIGHTWFLNNKFKVNKNVLIPRSETEELVHLVIQENRNRTNLTILDIGTGSGCIAISIKKAFPLAKVFALDISENAIEVGKENEQTITGKNEIQWICIDFLTNKFHKLPVFDIIISNPPYIKKNEINLIKNNVKLHEPHIALFVEDNNPFIFYKNIYEFALTHLIDKGLIYLEINNQLSCETANLFKEFGETKVLKDMYGNERFIKVIK